MAREMKQGHERIHTVIVSKVSGVSSSINTNANSRAGLAGPFHA